MTEVISIGLDGAAWHKLDQLIADGDLPNLKSLVDGGARGPLRSVSPPVTCPAWRCSTSGKNPGQLGVYWWLTLDRERGEFFHPDANSFDTADIWDYLSDEDFKSAVLNIPMTYPPSELDGTMVSGFGAPLTDQQDEHTSITYPAAFQERLYDEYDWEIEVDDLSARDGPEQAYNIIKSRFELLLDLTEEGYDYLHLTIFYINMLQHKYGDSEETRKAWKLIDSYLGELPDDVLIVIYSDHGHTNIENTFVINRWLHDRGYLSFEDKDEGESLPVADSSEEGFPRRAIRRLGSTAEKLLPYSVATTLSPLYRRVVPPNHRSSIDVAEDVNWEKSDAVATSQGPVYLNRERLGDNYETVKNELKRDLGALEFEGERVLEHVRHQKEVYSGAHAEAGPDLMLTAKEGWEIYGGLTEATFVDQATSWTSGNHPEGIILMNGPDVEAKQMSESSILDIMPTVLSYMNVAVPNDIDGTVLEQPFEHELPLERRDPINKKAPSSEENNQIKQSLEDLGYLE